MSTTSAARIFDETFHKQARQLEADLGAVTSLTTPQEKSNSLNNCLEDLANLQRSVQDAASYSNNHDQAVYASTLKKLQANAENVRNSITPKSKFKFKSARQTNAGIATPEIEGNVVSKRAMRTSETNAAADVAEVPAGLLGNGTTTISRSHITVSPRRLNELSAKSVQHVYECVLDLATQAEQPSTSLSITDVSNSILHCGRIDGPLHMTSIKSTVIFAKAHQLRIHDCEDVTLYLDVGSQPVIERCTNMRFAPLDGEARPFWNQVLDFQYPGGNSPNWTPVLETERLHCIPSSGAVMTLAGLQNELRAANISTISEDSIELSKTIV